MPNQFLGIIVPLSVANSRGTKNGEPAEGPQARGNFVARWLDPSVVLVKLTLVTPVQGSLMPCENARSGGAFMLQELQRGFFLHRPFAKAAHELYAAEGFAVS